MYALTKSSPFDWISRFSFAQLPVPGAKFVPLQLFIGNNKTAQAYLESCAKIISCVMRTHRQKTAAASAHMIACMCCGKCRCEPCCGTDFTLLAQFSIRSLLPLNTSLLRYSATPIVYTVFHSRNSPYEIMVDVIKRAFDVGEMPIYCFPGFIPLVYYYFLSFYCFVLCGWIHSTFQFTRMLRFADSSRCFLRAACFVQSLSYHWSLTN